MTAASKRLCHLWKSVTPDLPAGQRKFFKIFDPAAGAWGARLPGGFSGLCGAPDKGPGRRLEEICCGRWTQGPPRRPRLEGGRGWE
jgi:hypothetical protein